MNTEAVRAFVSVVEEGGFQDAALTLGVSQQAVSKRIASLEKSLDVVLFHRGPRRAELTVDGRVLLPHAKTLLAAADRAVQSVRPGFRPLRVDVRGRRLAAAHLLYDFHESHPDVQLDVVTLSDGGAAVSALENGSIDAALTYLHQPEALPPGIRHVHVYDEPLEILVGPRHPLAHAKSTRIADLATHRLWVPGIVPGTEWAAYYASLATAFDIEIDSTGPDFGVEHLLDIIADSRTVATFLGARTRIVWPARHELRRLRLAEPTPVYPWSFLWHDKADGPALSRVRDHLTRMAHPPLSSVWSPVRRDGVA